AAVAGAVTRPRNNLPPAVILPEKLVHNSGRVIPGAFAGLMGRQRDPWIIEAAPFDAMAYGAFPEYEFDHQERPQAKKNKVFQIPNLSLPQGVGSARFDRRLRLLDHIDAQRRALDRAASTNRFDRYHQGAIALLTQARVRQAFDLEKTDPRLLERYGRNSF